MRKLGNELQNRNVDIHNLMSYGFIKNNNHYEYQDYLLDKNFKMIVRYSNGKMTSKVIDMDMNEEYLLVDIPGTSGEFLGKIREEYNDKLKDIINSCSTLEIFKSEYTKLVINYVRNKYNDELEFLWARSPKNAVFRNKETNKWYGALLTIPASKIGLDNNEIIEIIDLKNRPEEIKKMVDNNNYFPGYHMNKLHWFTIKLDGSIPIEKIFEFIDVSYNIK